MCDKHAEQQDYIDLQREMFAAARNRGLPPALLAKRSGLNATTVNSWANGTAMPAWCFSILCRFLPDEISSMMMEPSDKRIVPVVVDDTALDDLACEAIQLGAEYSRARHPESPGGVAIVPQEREPMRARARRVGSLAAAVVAA